MKVIYDGYSPYSKTSQNYSYLEQWNPISIPTLDNDKELKIDKIYENKPHLLAYDLYGSSKLWWVFALRNPDVIKDPIYDFKQGVSIFITDKDDLLRLIDG